MKMLPPLVMIVIAITSIGAAKASTYKRIIPVATAIKGLCWQAPRNGVPLQLDVLQSTVEGITFDVPFDISQQVKNAECKRLYGTTSANPVTITLRDGSYFTATPTKNGIEVTGTIKSNV